MHTPSFVMRPRFLILSGIVLLMALIHLYWVNSFFVNAPTTVSAPYAQWTRGLFPLSESFELSTFLGPSIGGLLSTLSITQLINWLILPWIMVWMVAHLRSNWRRIAWYERSGYVLVLLVAGSMIVTMWSPFGQTMLQWLVD